MPKDKHMKSFIVYTKDSTGYTPQGSSIQGNKD